MIECQFVNLDTFEKCNQSVEVIPDRTQKTKLVWHDTGRKEFGNKVIVQTRMYPMTKTNYCYYHNKHKKGLFNVKRRKI